MSAEVGLETSRIPVVLVLAVSENGVIGRGDALPWDLPDDLQHFKRLTMGCPVLMGRKTFDSVGRPLPGRTNSVLTRNAAWQAPGVITCTELDDALARAAGQAFIDGAHSVCVIGGAQIYRLCLPIADKVVLTEVHGNVSGDATFDLEMLSGWQESSRQAFPAGDRNSHNFSIVELSRCG